MRRSRAGLGALVGTPAAAADEPLPCHEMHDLCRQMNAEPHVNPSPPPRSSSRLLVASPDHPPKHIHPDPFTFDFALGLVLRVRRDRHLLPLDPPPTRLLAKLGQPVASQIEPAAQHRRLDLAERLADLARDADADQVLEAGDVGVEVGVEVVALERGPELRVLGRLEEGGEEGELLDRFCEVGRRDRGVDVLVGDGGRGQEGEAEGEDGRGEDGERFDEDVGHGFRVQEVGVELVSGLRRAVSRVVLVTKRAFRWILRL